jgi:hypothetical protein
MAKKNGSSANKVTNRTDAGEATFITKHARFTVSATKLSRHASVSDFLPPFDAII